MKRRNFLVLVLCLCSSCQQTTLPVSQPQSNPAQTPPAQTQQVVETQTPTGQHWATTCVAISPDGARLAVGDAAGNIVLHDIAANIDLWSLKGNGQPVHDLSFLPDGRIVVAGDAVHILGAGDGTVVDTLNTLPTGVHQLAATPDGQILTATTDGRLLIYSLKHKTIEALKQQDSPVVALDVSRDGSRAAAAAQDKFVRLWNLEQQQVTQTIQGGEAKVVSVAISPRLDQIAAGDAGGNVFVWKFATGEPARTLSTQPGPVSSILFTLDNDRLLTAADDGFVRLFRTSDGQLLHSSKLGSAVRALDLSPEGTLLAAGTESGETFLIQIAADLQVLRTAVRTPPVQ